MSQSRFDGLEVDQYLARFTGTFELEPHEVEYLSADSTIVAIVVARVDGAQFRVDKKSGEVKRVNTLDVQGFAVVDDPQLRETLFQHLAALQVDAVFTPPPEREQEMRVAIDEAERQDDAEATYVKPQPPVAVVPESDEEVFSPGQESRIAVGGAVKNDPVLRRFIDER